MPRIRLRAGMIDAFIEGVFVEAVPVRLAAAGVVFIEDVSGSPVPEYLR